MHAIGRGPAAVVEEVPAIGLTCRDAHALNDATKSASINAMRMVFISRVYAVRPQARHVS
jgi:hypothetical protein